MDRPLEFYIYRHRLPHWRQEGATYHVTWSLHSEQDALYPEERTLVLAALRHVHQQRYDLVAAVVMDDHVHTMVRPEVPHKLERIVQSWKSFTANRLQREFGRIGWIRQAEYYDRIMRNEEELLETLRYIADNPRERWPDVGGLPLAERW
jgi:REP element-mobilizing transposase RayT